jgi:hypothetical protein
MVAVLSLILAHAACSGDLSERHHRSSDGKTEVVYVFDDEAIFQHRVLGEGGKSVVRYDVARATPGDEPDDPSVTRDKIDKVLVRDVSEGCLLESKQGIKLIICGYEQLNEQDLPFDELVKNASQRKKLFWLIDAQTVLKANTLDALAKLAPLVQSQIASAKLEGASLLFGKLAAAASGKK